MIWSIDKEGIVGCKEEGIYEVYEEKSHDWVDFDGFFRAKIQ